ARLQGDRLERQRQVSLNSAARRDVGQTLQARVVVAVAPIPEVESDTRPDQSVIEDFHPDDAIRVGYEQAVVQETTNVNVGKRIHRGSLRTGVHRMIERSQRKDGGHVV